MNLMRRFGRSNLAAVMVPVAAVLLLTTGCTSALTTAYLSGTPWSLREPHAATDGDEADEAPSPDKAGDTASYADGKDSRPENAEAEDRDERRAAAIEEAVSRLSGLGTLDEATQASLVATLQRTAQEDWPVVVAEFAAALKSAAPAPAVVPAAESRMAAKPDTSLPTTSAPEPPVPAGDAPASDALDASSPATDHAASAPLPDPKTEPAPAAPAPAPAPPPSLTVNTACFASRVQAWGVFDRFPHDRFQPGQDVIVYFELDGLSARQSTAGHTTCIDAALRLVDTEGRTLHDWSFEPIAETCVSRRHDYFARYVVRMPPAAAPGPCRVELTVTDMLAGTTATATLPLEIAAD